MSGGVDSSLTAGLLKEQGYEVVGATMQIASSSACSKRAVTDAKKVALQLNIDHTVIDLSQDFQEKVIDYFVDEYLAGHTPNPCVRCNRYIKFAKLIELAQSIGIEQLATGHYARVEKKSGRYVIKKAVDLSKDQSYFLYDLTQDQLAHVVFPLGEYSKSNVRSLAEKMGLVVANKPESMEVCFLDQQNYGEFIEQQLKHKKVTGEAQVANNGQASSRAQIVAKIQTTGKIQVANNSQALNQAGFFMTSDGQIVGKHQGIFNYTIGQRKGLRIASSEPYYVLAINVQDNNIIVGRDNETYAKQLVAGNTNWLAFSQLEKSMVVQAKIRSSMMPTEATIEPLPNNQVRVIFTKAVRAITPGQSVVFYDDDYVVGGGKIERVE